MRKNNKSHGNQIQLITAGAPFDFVEAYKSLRTNLLFASVDKKCQKIVVTSTIPGEGKSSVSLNLAIALAGSESKVLLVDADLRKSVLHRYLHVSSSAVKVGGLTNVLAGLKKLDECIIHFSDIGINFLSTGPLPSNPAELIGSLKMKEIVDKLDTQFDYIIFDTPPVSVVTDAAVLSTLADGVIFVVRQNYATIESAQVAKKNLENVGAKVIGSVLNDFTAKKSNKSYSYYHYKKYDYGYK